MNQTIDQILEYPSEMCTLCGTFNNEVLANELRRGDGMVYYCRKCDYGYLVQDKEIDLKQYYSELYRQEYSHNSEAAATDARELFQVYKDYQEDRLQQIAPYLTSSSSLLEVGASSGQFLVHIKDLVARVSAIELDTACCEFLRNELAIDVAEDFLENSRFSGQTYDVVCAFQVIEHVERPVEFLRSLRLATKKGGTIFIECPNLHDPLRTVWDLPTYQKFFYHSAHLHYFTETSLRKVAVDAGFMPDEVEVTFTQDYNVLNHLHWLMNNGPQADCHVGLSEIKLRGNNEEISEWLTAEMRTVNKKYIDKLVQAKCTSNMMMKLSVG